MNIILKDVSFDSIIYLRRLIHEKRFVLIKELKSADDDSTKIGLSCEIDCLDQISLNL